MSESPQSALPSLAELVLECWAIANTLSEPLGGTVADVLPFLPDHLISEVFKTPRANWPFFLSRGTRIPETLATRLWDIGRAHELRAYAFRYLGPWLPDAKIRTIVENLAEIDESERVDTVLALTAHLPVDLIEEALRVVGSLPHRSEALCDLAARLGEVSPMSVDRFRRQLLAAARTLADPGPRAEALLALLPWLGEQSCRDVLTEISAAIGQLTEGFPRYRLLCKLLPHLYDKEYRDTYLWAISEACDHSYPPWFSFFPRIVAERSTQAFLMEVLDKLHHDEAPKCLTRGILLLPSFNAPLWRRAVELVTAIEWDKRSKAEALAYLSMQAPAEIENAELEPLLSEGVSLLAEIEEFFVDPSIPTPMSSWARGRYLEQNIGPSREDRYVDFAALLASFLAVATSERFAPDWPEWTFEEYGFTDRLLDNAVRGNRYGPARVCMLRAIVPFLRDEQRPDVINECLRRARDIYGPVDRALQLTLIIPFDETRKRELFEEALAAARLPPFRASEGGFRSKVLVGLAEFAEEAEREGILLEALAAARSVEHSTFRFRYLLELIRYLLAAEPTVRG